MDMGSLSDGTDASRKSIQAVAGCHVWLNHFLLSSHGYEVKRDKIMGAFDPLITYEKGTFIGKYLPISLNTVTQGLTVRNGHGQYDPLPIPS